MAVGNPSVIHEVAVPPANKLYYKYTYIYIYVFVNNTININTLAQYTLGLHADRHNSTKLPGYKFPSSNVFITKHFFHGVAVPGAGPAVSHSSENLQAFFTLLLQCCGREL